MLSTVYLKKYFFVYYQSTVLDASFSGTKREFRGKTPKQDKILMYSCTTKTN